MRAFQGSGKRRKWSGLVNPLIRKTDSTTHFVKPVSTSSLPSHVVSLSIWAEPDSDAKSAASWDCRLRRWSLVHRYRKHGRDTVVESFNGTTAVEFWFAMGKIVTAKTKPWIITPDASGVFRLLDGWELSDSGLIEWGSLVDAEKNKRERTAGGVTFSPCQMILSDSITVLSHEFAPGRLTWVSIGNYLPCNIGQFARSVGIDYDDSMDYGPSGGSFQYDCQTSAKVIDRYFEQLMQNYLNDGGGHWRTTAAQLSHQTFRRSFMTTPILETKDSELYSLERDGIFGGRQEAYFVGTVGDAPGTRDGEQCGPPPLSDAVESGPLYQFDIRSQYPAILARMPFPVAFCRWMSGVSIEELESICRVSGCLARVELSTPSPDYPCRIDGNYTSDVVYGVNKYKKDVNKARSRTIFPVGTFTATLYGPELLHAIQNDRVVRILSVASYRAGYPFRDYAESLLKKRGEARGNGDSARESLLKLLANSFAGKWASRSGGWKTVRGRCAPEQWGEWYEADVATNTYEAWRSLSGICQRFEPMDDSPSGCPYVFGYLTSYGRVQLLEILRVAGEHGCIWCHTDGVVLTQSGMERVRAAGLVGEGEPGKLRYEGEVERCRVWGPSHFFCNGDWTLAGYTGSKWLDSLGNVLDWRRPTVRDLIMSRGEDVLSLRVQTSTLQTARQDGLISPTGWTLPATVSNGVVQGSSLPGEY